MPKHPRDCTLQEKKPLQPEALGSQMENRPHSLQLEEARMQQGRPSTAKTNKYSNVHMPKTFFKEECVWKSQVMHIIIKVVSICGLHKKVSGVPRMPWTTLQTASFKSHKFALKNKPGNEIKLSFEGFLP